MDLYADPIVGPARLEVRLEPAPPSPDKGPSQEVAVRGMLGRVNRILIGTSETSDVLEKWPGGEQLQGEIEALRPDWAFDSVRIGCSFVPDRRARFTWARLIMGLEATITKGAVSGEPIAFDLFPRDVGQTHTYSRNFKITPALKFAFAELSGEAGISQDVLVYEPSIAVAGLLTTTPTWTFTAPARPGLTGSKELFLIVKRPRFISVRARFKVGAEVATEFGPVALRSAIPDEAVDQAFDLGTG